MPAPPARLASAAPLLAGAALGVLFSTAARALLSTLFSLSLATLRLNGTALWSLVLLAPLLAPLLPRSRWAALLCGASVAALPFARFTSWYVPVAALAVAAGALAFARHGRAARVGFLLGLLVDGALLLLGGSHDPLLAPWGALAALALTLVALPDAPRDEARPSLGAGVAWACLLALHAAFLAAPYTLARHVGASVVHVVPAALAGALLGLLAARRVPGGLALAAGLVAALDVALLRGPLLLLLSVATLHAALALAASRLAPPHGATLGPALAGVLFALLFFGQTLGPLEWGLAAPALCVVALLGALARVPHSAVPWRPAFAVLAVGLLGLPAALAPPVVEPHEGAVVTIVDWNVHQGFGNRGPLDPHVYADALRRMRPDVLILQEADTTRLSSGGLDIVGFLARELGLHPVATGSSIVILSRFPAAGPAVSEGWWTRVPLDVGNATVTVQGIHLARSATERAAQTDALLAFANETQGPLVLGGDLNSCPAPTCFRGRPSDRIHEKLGTAYQDAWTALHAPDDPAGHTHPARAPSRRIDVVMVRGLDVLASGPVRDDLTRLGSDHLPVLARVALG